MSWPTAEAPTAADTRTTTAGKSDGSSGCVPGRLLWADRRAATLEGGATFAFWLTRRVEGPVEFTAEHLEAIEGSEAATFEPEGKTMNLKVAIG